MKKQHTFDHIVVNQQQHLDSVVSSIRDIITTEKQRTASRQYSF
jgi:hypothetical protein